MPSNWAPASADSSLGSERPSLHCPQLTQGLSLWERCSEPVICLPQPFRLRRLLLVQVVQRAQVPLRGPIRSKKGMPHVSVKLPRRAM
jgi:hypothetical protein